MAEDSRYRQPLRNPDNRGNCPGCGYSSFGKVWRQFCCREPECRENRNVPCFFSVWKFSEDTVFPWPGLGKHLHNTIKADREDVLNSVKRSFPDKVFLPGDFRSLRFAKNFKRIGLQGKTVFSATGVEIRIPEGMEKIPSLSVPL